MIDDWGERGTCPRCASGEVVHFAFGLPANPDSAPPWLRFAGCVVDGTEVDRRC